MSSRRRYQNLKDALSTESLGSIRRRLAAPAPPSSSRLSFSADRRVAEFITNLHADVDKIWKGIGHREHRIANREKGDAKHLAAQRAIVGYLLNAIDAASKLEAAVKEGNVVSVALEARSFELNIARAGFREYVPFINSGIKVEEGRQRGGWNRGDKIKKQLAIEIAKQIWSESPRLSVNAVAKNGKLKHIPNKTVRNWITPYKPT